jgi:hypothetical protein
MDYTLDEKFYHIFQPAHTYFVCLSVCLSVSLYLCLSVSLSLSRSRALSLSIAGACFITYPVVLYYPSNLINNKQCY